MTDQELIEDCARSAAASYVQAGELGLMEPANVDYEICAQELDRELGESEMGVYRKVFCAVANHLNRKHHVQSY